MGADIHLFVEQKVSDKWKLVYPQLIEVQDEWPARLDSRNSEKYRSLHDRFPGTWVSTYEDYTKIVGTYEQRAASPFYVSRNYDLFAILADVRNEDRGFEPISPPKGVPSDASPDYQWVVEKWKGDGHSHSYFTVSELLAYEWDRLVRRSGWVGPNNYHRFKTTGAPTSWSGFVGGRVQHLSNEEMDDHLTISPLDVRDPEDWGASLYTHISWEDLPSVDSFLTKTLPALQELGDPDTVRICFFFDN